MSIDIGIFSLQQFDDLQQSLGNNFRPGIDYPAHPVDRMRISLGAVINNVNLGNGLEYYEHGFPNFKIIRNDSGIFKLKFVRESVENWSLDEPNVDGLADREFDLILDDGNPIGVKFMDGNHAQPDIDWLYFIELESNLNPQDPDTEGDALYRMEANNHLSSNPEQKRGESDNPAAPAALTGQFLGAWGGKKRRKKRTKKKSRKTRKKRKKKTKKRRKKRKRKKRKTRR